MRTPTRVTLAAAALLIYACAVYAQETAHSQGTAAPWVSVSPEGEEFLVKMPKTPAPSDVRANASGNFAGGRRYESAGDDSNTYAVWSLTFMTGRGESLVPERYVNDGVPPGEVFLDFVADFVWDMIVNPELEEAVRRKEKLMPSASLIRFFDLNGRPAREYRIWLRERGGPVYVYYDGRRTYVVTAFGPDPQSPLLKQFVESFAVRTKTDKFPPPVTLKVDPILLGGGAPSSSGPGRGGGVGSGTGVVAPKDNAGAPTPPADFNMPFKPAEVTKKAVITAKPEPGFTESARKFNVTGTVRIRAILSAAGTVEGAHVVKWLPHGLTQRALAAARQIRFEPAQKDGKPVSQYVTLEYNFNIY